LGKHRIFYVHNPEDAGSRALRDQYRQRLQQGRKETRQIEDGQGNVHEIEVFDASDLRDVEYGELDFRAVRDVLPIRTAPCVLLVVEADLDPETLLTRLRSIANPGGE